MERNCCRSNRQGLCPLAACVSRVEGEGCLKLDRGEPAESALVSSLVLGVFNPVGDRVVC